MATLRKSNNDFWQKNLVKIWQNFTKILKNLNIKHKMSENIQRLRQSHSFWSEFSEKAPQSSHSRLLARLKHILCPIIYVNVGWNWMEKVMNFFFPFHPTPTTNTLFFALVLLLLLAIDFHTENNEEILFDSITCLIDDDRNYFFFISILIWMSRMKLAKKIRVPTK